MDQFTEKAPLSKETEHRKCWLFGGKSSYKGDYEEGFRLAQPAQQGID
jgi:hypothetical protein